MQLITLASGVAAAFLATTVAADTEWNKNGTGTVPNRAKVINNCPYKVYLWSILKGQGCPSEQGVVLNTGDFYHEAYRTDAKTGVSIKISKTNQCKGVDITQLEYFENHVDGMAFNFLDVSYVDCLDGDCPGRKDGYFLKSGNANKATIADSSQPKCPTFSCSDKASCDKTSYVLPDDVQTKSCEIGEPLDFFLCGGEAKQPVEEKPSPSSSAKSSPSPSSSSSEEKKKPASSSTPVYVNKEAATPVVTPSPKPSLVKTEVVYVTQYEYVNAKRHAHNHVHKHFRA